MTANAGAGPTGEILSGWKMRTTCCPCWSSIPKPFTTDRAIDFIQDTVSSRGACICPTSNRTSPYIARRLITRSMALRRCWRRSVLKTPSDHPVYTAFRQHEWRLEFLPRGRAPERIPTYMGLIKQVDDQLGRLFDLLHSTGRWDDTLIVFTSDHGDFLVITLLGEKEFLLEPAVGVPLIVRDPSGRRRCHAGHGGRATG